MINYISLNGALHMILDGRPFNITKEDSRYHLVNEALKAHASESDILAILTKEESKLAAAFAGTTGIAFSGGAITYQGEPIDSALNAHILRMIDEGFDVAPMVKFLQNLMLNPSHRVINHLYRFLEFGKSPITEDGHFLVYKAVNQDFKDIYTGKIDNSIGCVCKIPRRMVNDDPRETCSYGLHVCSFDYLPYFAHIERNGHVVVCKVNPANVVAIPYDYNNTKMRVCEYEVIAEYVDYYTKMYDVLASASVAPQEGVLEPAFVVKCFLFDEEAIEEKVYSIEEAMKKANLLLEDDTKDFEVIEGWNVRENKLLFRLNSRSQSSPLEGDTNSIGQFLIMEEINESEMRRIGEPHSSLSSALREVLSMPKNIGENNTIHIVGPDGDIKKTLSN